MHIFFDIKPCDWKIQIAHAPPGTKSPNSASNFQTEMLSSQIAHVCFFQTKINVKNQSHPSSLAVPRKYADSLETYLTSWNIAHAHVLTSHERPNYIMSSFLKQNVVKKNMENGLCHPIVLQGVCSIIYPISYHPWMVYLPTLIIYNNQM